MDYEWMGGQVDVDWIMNERMISGWMDGWLNGAKWVDE